MTRKAVSLFGAIGILLALGMSASAQTDDPPWDCTKDDLPQQGLNYCGWEEFSEADETLNQVYKQVRKYVRTLDKDYAENDSNLVGAEKALLKAQRAWIDYRDGQCELAGFYARGGSLETLLVANCQTELTRQRTKELRAVIEQQN